MTEEEKACLSKEDIADLQNFNKRLIAVQESVDRLENAKGVNAINQLGSSVPSAEVKTQLIASLQVIRIHIDALMFDLTRELLSNIEIDCMLANVQAKVKRLISDKDILERSKE